jgi:hypothetical protein
VRYRRDPERDGPHVSKAAADLRALLATSQRVLAGKVSLTANDLAAGRDMTDQAARNLAIWLQRGEPAPAEAAEAQRLLAEVPRVNWRLMGLEAFLRQGELARQLPGWEAWTRSTPQQTSVFDAQANHLTALAQQTWDATQALRRAIEEGRHPSIVEGLAADLALMTERLDTALQDAMNVSRTVRTMQEDVAARLDTLAALGSPEESLRPDVRASAREVVDSPLPKQFDEFLDGIDRVLATGGQLVNQLGARPPALAPTGDLGPATSVVGDLASGPVPDASALVLQQMQTADQALRELGTTPGARERAEQALAQLRAAISAADATVASLDLALRRLRAEVDVARSRTPGLRPPEVAQAEDLTSGRVQEAVEAVLRDARTLLAAGALHLDAVTAPAEQDGLRVGPLSTESPSTPMRSEPQRSQAPQEPGPLAEKLAEVLRKLRPHFPGVYIQADGETLAVTPANGGTFTVVVRPEPAEAGGPRPRAGEHEHPIEVPDEIGVEDMLRRLAFTVAVLLQVEESGARAPRGATGAGRAGLEKLPLDGQIKPLQRGRLKELDVLAIEHAWAQHHLAQETDEERRQGLQADVERLTGEFRRLAEGLGLLRRPGRPADPDMQTRANKSWPHMSDAARAMLGGLAQQGGAVSARSAQARSHLPMTEDFRQAYLAIDYFKYLMGTIEDPALRQRYETELLPRIDAFQERAVPGFKTVYREFFPSTSYEVPLEADAAQAAVARVQPLVEETQRMLAEITEWAASTGLPELAPDAIDDSIRTTGADAWRTEYERIKGMVDDLLTRFDYKGQPLGYIGSMQDGWRGPHKGMVHADLRAFDLDLWVLHPDEYDRLYDEVMRTNADLVSRGKIFPDPEATPELFLLSKRIQEALEELLPGVDEIGTSEIVLRRDPPY